MIKIKASLLFALCLLYCTWGFGKTLFREIVIQSDTTKYYQSKNTVQYLNEKFLFFKVNSNEEICEITLYPDREDHLKTISLLASSDYTVLDTFVLINNEYFRGKIKFNDLSSTRFSRLVVQSNDVNGRASVEEFKLFPYFETAIFSPIEEEELYVNEDKSIDLVAINSSNIRIEDGDWSSTNHLDYKISSFGGKVQLILHPRTAGEEVLKIKLKTIKPYLNEFNQLTYDLKTVTVRMQIKPGRINFLNLDQAEFFLDPSFSKNYEVQIDVTRALGIKRTYRIENQQEPGGKLIAELFTVSQVGNSNKILCWLKTYSLHRRQEGYLFLKDGDQTKFMTNFDIIQHPKIDRVTIMKEGGDAWQSNLVVSPGENIEVKIDGTGLSKAEVLFDMDSRYTLDTARRTDYVMFFLMKIPIEVNKRKTNIFNRVSVQYWF